MLGCLRWITKLTNFTAKTEGLYDEITDLSAKIKVDQLGSEKDAKSLGYLKDALSPSNRFLCPAVCMFA